MRILDALPPHNLFGVESEYENSKVIVFPVPYDSTVSYRSGAREGPHAIIEASRNLELFSEELETDVSKIGVFTVEDLEPDVSSPENNIRRIEKEVLLALEDGKVPLLLGGDHSIALGGITAASRKYKEFTVLHFDAHSDARDEYMGSKYGHANVMARAREISKSCISIGVRSTFSEAYSKHEKDTIYRKNMRGKSPEEIGKDIAKKSKGRVYITIDVDVLDPGIMPSTGTPEPDGLSFHELTHIIKTVLEDKELIGMDVCELNPIPGIVAPDFLVAKMTYLILGYAFCKK